MPRLILIFLSLIAINVFSQSKTNVALNDLSPQGVMESGASVLISDRLRNELFNTGAFAVIERSQMEEILKEQGFQQSGACNTDACVVQAGQLLGVQYILVGTIGKIGSTYTINVRMIDVGTGKVVQTANSDCRCEIDDVLSHSTAEIAKKMAKGIDIAPTASVMLPVAPVVKKPEFGTVIITSKPSGASIQIDGIRKGSTPLIDENVSPGKHPVIIDLEGYKPITDKFKITAGDTTKLSYTLKMIPKPKVKEETTTIEKAVRIRFALGSAALIGAAVGLYNNEQAQKKVDEANKYKTAYESAETYEERNRFYAIYKDNLDQAEEKQLPRNVAYLISAIFAAGFGISYAF